MPLELQNAVVGLVLQIMKGRTLEMPPWLVRPVRAECGKLWPLVRRIYDDLTGLELPEVMRPVERRQVVCVFSVKGQPPRILEVDETQHFNTYRARTFRHYMGKIPLAFDAALWVERSEAKVKLEGGGFSKPKPPLFPEEGGRHRQRAFRDALCDILPLSRGYLPTLRVAHFQVEQWIFTSVACQRMKELLTLALR